MAEPASARAIRIAPSILAADLLRLGDLLAEVERAGADRVHVDVMDGHFVPNLSMGVPIVEAVRGGTRLPIEVHLMIERPERYVEAFVRAGADAVLVHPEASPNLHRTLQRIRELGGRAGAALNPATPATALDEVGDLLDGILVMTVNPGFGGQRFLEGMLGKIRRLRAGIEARGRPCDLGVDGGVDATTAPLAVAAGADVLIAGTSVFAHRAGAAAGVQALQEACTPRTGAP